MNPLHDVFVGSEGVRMAFSPNESRQSGGGLLVLAFSDDTPLRHDADYFISFEGRHIRHLVTALRINHVTFHSQIPEHRVSETVQLSILISRDGVTKALASSRFKYIPDTVQSFAEFLLGSVYDPESLENIDRLKIEFKDAFKYDEKKMDKKVCQCLARMTLPESWHMLGANSLSGVPQETLLHLCARLGLRWTAQYLLNLPGGHDACKMANIQDDTPADLCNMYGHRDMTELFDGKLSSWSGDPPWLDADTYDKGGTSTKIRRVNQDIFMLTSASRDNHKSLYDDLALLQEVLIARKRPPSSAVDGGYRSRSLVSPLTESLSTTSHMTPAPNPRIITPAPNPRIITPAPNPRIRSKSDGVMQESVSGDSEDDVRFNATDCHSNHHHRHRHRRHVPDSSQPTSYHAYHHHRQNQPTAIQPYIHNHNSRTVSMETDPVDQIWTSSSSTDAGYHGNQEYKRHISASSADWETPVLEESIRKLHEIHSNVTQRLHESAEQYKSTDQSEANRKDNLQRFSTSCPSLPDSAALSKELQLLPNQDADNLLPEDSELSALALSSGYFTSYPAMPHGTYPPDLSHDSAAMADNMNSMPLSPTTHSQDMMHQDITICVNDITVDSSDDFVAPPSGSDESNASIIEQVKKANKRRSSWCPEEGRKKEEKHEKQKMLNVTGRSQSLSSLDGDSDEDDEDEDEDDVSSTSSSYQNVPNDSSPAHYSGSSSGRSPAGASGITSASNTPVNGSVVSMMTRGHMTASDLSGRLISTIHRTDLEISDVQTMSPANSDVSGPVSPGDPHSPNDDTHVLMYPVNLAKASSSPSITTTHHHENKEIQRLDFQEQNKMVGQSGEDDIEADSDSRQDWALSQSQGAVKDMTDSTMLAEEEEDRPKIEKKRKSSVFSKFGSYRMKKVVKDPKLLRNTHQFVGVCFSNSTFCDVCNKSMANKPALQCENCMVNVHENSCKDQIAPCAKYRPNRCSNGEAMKDKKSSSLPETVNHSVNLKSSQSFKETRRAISVPARPALQCSSSASVLVPRSSSPSANGPSVGSSGHFQWRRVANRLGIDRVINEEREKTKDEEPSQSSGQSASPQFLETNNITDTLLSVSMESLEEANTELADFEEEFTDEPEAWSVTVDKKTLKKMSAKDIKRQDHIWELIQTERSHCRTLRIMQKIFSRGMRHEAGMSQDMIDRIFPCLSELVHIHTTFLMRLTDRQRLRVDRSMEDVGDILVLQFDGEMGERMKVAYGDFCSRHAMAVQLYKDILKSDRKFQTFIKKCSRSTICKRLSIPECILLVTQRVTKYPLLIEPIIKTTKDNRNDKERLLRALPLMREILVYIDAQVDAHEKEQRLIEIYNKLDARSYAMYMGEKFKKSNLLGSRKLIHEGYMKWMTARGKSFEVLAVILSDVMFFLAENNQKFTFFSQDCKSTVVPLCKLLVREKGDTRDSKGIYLIWQSKTEPEMYEFVCRSGEERKSWIKVIRSAVLRFMEAEGVDVSKQPELEGEKKELEAKSARIRQLVDHLYERDSVVRKMCDQKINVIVEMLEVFCKEEINKNMQSVIKEEEGCDGIDMEVWSTLKNSIQDSSQFLSRLLLGNAGSSLCQSSTKSSQDESALSTPTLPKRAETFSGFDQKDKVKKRYNSGQLAESERSDSQLSLNESESVPQPKEPSASNSSSHKEKTRGLNSTVLKSTTTDAVKTSQDAESADMSHDLPNNMVASIQELLTAPSKEQCECLAQLMQYLHNLVCITSNQLTEVEKFRAQLAEANSKVSTLYAENKRLSHGFHHDKQLEILREQQEMLRQERTQLDRLRDFDRHEREEEKAKIIQLQQEVEKEKAELRAQREDIQHQKEILQRQMDLFEANKRRVLQATESPKPLGLRERSESPASRGISPASRGSQSSLLEVSHRRSASDDLTHGPSPDRSIDGVSGTKEGGKTRIQASTSAPSPRRDSTSVLPIHLFSATNEQKLGQMGQQLPLKLVAVNSGKMPLPQPTAAPSAASKTQTSSGVQQMLPFKLSTGAQASQSKASHSATGSPRTSQHAAVRSATLDSSMRSLSHSQSHSHSQRPLVSVGRTSSGTRMPGSMNVSGQGNMLPMKLAEKPRPKSASSASAAGVTVESGDQPHSHKQPSSSTATNEEEVIYF